MHEKITRLTGMFAAPSEKHQQQQQQQQLQRQQQQKNPSTSKRNAIVSSVNRGTMSSSSSSSTSSSSTSSGNTKQQQQQPAQSQSITNKDKSSSGAVSGKSATEESVPVVRMRNKPPLSQIQQEATTNGTAPDAIGNSNNSRSVLQRGLDVLNEITPEDDGSEEIRKLDSQLDHLNHYMDKVEERIKAHNEKLMDTLRQQREEREKRRRSFHERIAQNQQEDDDFQRQISTLLNRVDISKNRASMYDIISQMEIPKANGQ